MVSYVGDRKSSNYLDLSKEDPDNLKFGVGLDHIDLHFAVNNIVVTNTPDVLTDAMHLHIADPNFTRRAYLWEKK